MYIFFEKYFLINLKDYPNIGIDFPITMILSCFFFGLIVTTVIVNYRRSKIEAIIKQLTRHDALDESSAKTLAEMHLDTKVFRYLLSKNEGQLASIVARAGEVKKTYEEYIKSIKGKGTKEEKINFDEARFYIRESGSDRAKRVLELGSSSILNTILFCILLIAVYICIALLMPGILSMINSFLGSI